MKTNKTDEGWEIRFDTLSEELRRGGDPYFPDWEKIKDFIRQVRQTAYEEGKKEAELDNTREEWIDHKIQRAKQDLLSQKRKEVVGEIEKVILENSYQEKKILSLSKAIEIINKILK